MFSQRPAYYSTQRKLSEGRSKGAESEAKMTSKITVHVLNSTYILYLLTKKFNSSYQRVEMRQCRHCFAQSVFSYSTVADEQRLMQENTSHIFK